MSSRLNVRRGVRQSARKLTFVVLAACVILGGSSMATYAAQPVIVSPVPDYKQPRILDGRVYSIDSSGPMVVVGGTFTQERVGNFSQPAVVQKYVFLFDSRNGAISSSFRPVIDGEVESVIFAPDGQSIYVGGAFGMVNGTPVKNIVRLRLDGTILPGFAPTFNDRIKDMALTGNRLIVGGRFNQVNGQSVQYLTSIDPQTGARQTDFNLPATESRYEYAPYLQELDVSPDGRWLLIAGNFLKIGGISRNQIALIDLNGTPKVANWSTDRYANDCASVYNDSWIRGLDISPDSKFFVVSATGAYRGNALLCDTVSRWELPPVATGDGQQPTWIDHTGGDTLWASEITESAVYVGGHQRWHNNPRPSPGGDNDGPGSLNRPGIVALDPFSGVPLSWNPGRDRGRGAEAIHATSEFLFVGSDTNLWGGQLRQRLAVLPVAGGWVNPAPERIELPVTVHYTIGNTLHAASFDGVSFGPSTPISAPGIDGIDWTGVRDGFVQHGDLTYFGTSQAVYRRPYSTMLFGPATNLSTSVGYVDTNAAITPYDQPYGVAETTAATYSNGRIYYTKTGSSGLFWRGYSIESGVLGGMERVAVSTGFSDVRALDVIGDWLYTSSTDGRLYRYYMRNGVVQPTKTLVDSGASGINWSQVDALFSIGMDGTAPPIDPPTSPNCTGATPWLAQYYANTELDGGSTLMRCEDAINENWGNGAPPGTGLPSNAFSVRWTTTVTLAEAKAIKVNTTTDDGVRVYVDGLRILDAWTSGLKNSEATSPGLAAGDHTLVIDYYENTGAAIAAASYSLVDPPPDPPGPDNTPANGIVTTPTAGQNFPTSPFTVSGTATDNVGVTQIRIAVYNDSDPTNRWLQANGTFGPTYAYRVPTLGTPGGTSTTWQLPLSLPAGSYHLDVKARDAAANVDPTPPWVAFTVG